MEQINNIDTIRESSRVLGHQVENLPLLDTSKIILVSNVNPKSLRTTDVCEFISASTTGSKTAFTTSATKDFYLTGISASYAKDVTCDLATGPMSISVYVNGISKSIFAFNTITLTASQDNFFITFPIPIKLDRNQAISFLGTFTAGALARTLSIMGYYVENQQTL